MRRRKRSVETLPREIAVQQSLVGPDAQVIVDVGAGYGETVKAYRAAFPEATIYAFEPTPEAARELRERYGEQRVVVIDAAVGASVGSASLHVNRFQPTSSILPAAAAGPSFWGEGLLDAETTVSVPMTTLDRFCADHGIANVDLLKIDVQGAELFVLEGARGLLERKAVRALYFEVLMVETYEGQATLEEYLGLLRAFDYTPAGFYGQIIREGRLLSLDLLARPA